MPKKKKSDLEEFTPKLQPPWKLMWDTKGHKQYCFNKETKEVVWPDQFRTRFGKSSADKVGRISSPACEPSTSKETTETVTGFHADNFVTISEAVEPMEVEYVNEVLQAYRKESKDDKGNFNHISNKRLTEIEYRNTRNRLIVVFDTSALLQDPLIVRKTGTAKIQMRIPYTVLCELDGLKKSDDLRRQVNAVLKDLIATSDTSPELVSFENSVDSRLPFTLKSEIYSQSAPFVAETADERILKTALMLKEHVIKQSMKIVLVSNDCNLRAKARAHGLRPVDNEEFLARYVEPLEKMKTAMKSSSKREKRPPAQPEVITLSSSSSEDEVDTKRRRTTSPKKSPAYKLHDNLGAGNSRSAQPPPSPGRSDPQLLSKTDLLSSLTSHSTSKNSHQYRSKAVAPTVTTQMNLDPAQEITSWHFPEKIKAFVFTTELAKFQYVLRVSVEKTVHLLSQPDQDDALQNLLFHLCDVGYRFVMNEFKAEDLNDFVLQLEELYEQSVAHLNKHQKIIREQLIEELIAGGIEGEGIVAIKDCVDYVQQQRGWSPPTTVIPSA